MSSISDSFRYQNKISIWLPLILRKWKIRKIKIKCSEEIKIVLNYLRSWNLLPSQCVVILQPGQWHRVAFAITHTLQKNIIVRCIFILANYLRTIFIGLQHFMIHFFCNKMHVLEISAQISSKLIRLYRDILCHRKMLQSVDRNMFFFCFSRSIRFCRATQIS